MNILFQHQEKSLPLNGGGADALSPEAEKRSIELAFLRRLTAMASGAAAQILVLADQPDAGELFEDSYAQIRNPIFETISSQMEKSVPEDAGFGRFRSKK